MFKLHLDLEMHFEPPMDEYGTGIILTREIELPFVPVEGMRVFSRAFDDHADPDGFTLKDITWDIDRGVFLARTIMLNQDFPMPLIPGLLRTWVDHGWRFASYRDFYDFLEDDDEVPGNAIEAATGGVPDSESEWDEAEKAYLQTWKTRSAEVNRVLKALIRHMVETYDNEKLAYAFDKSGRFYSQWQTEHERHKPFIKEFADFAHEFHIMPEEAKNRWRKRTRRYPTLEALVAEFG